MYKQYLLKTSEFVSFETTCDDLSAWEDREYYFYTEEDMIAFVKSQLDPYFKVKAAFKIEKINNNIF
jgi:hypothetical protein